MIFEKNIQNAEVTGVDLVIQKTGTEKVTGSYQGTAFKEILSSKFIYEVYRNKLKSLVEKDFMKEIIEHNLGKYQPEID